MRVRIIETEVYSRVVGYYRPVQNWNRGKRSEFEERYLMEYEHGKAQDHEKTDESDRHQSAPNDTEQGGTVGAEEQTQGDVLVPLPL